MSFWIVLYLVLGAVIALIGCYLRAKAWRTTFTHELLDGTGFWIFGAVFWPLAFDLLVFHESPYTRGDVE